MGCVPVTRDGLVLLVTKNCVQMTAAEMGFVEMTLVCVLLVGKAVTAVLETTRRTFTAPCIVLTIALILVPHNLKRKD